MCSLITFVMNSLQSAFLDRRMYAYPLHVYIADAFVNSIDALYRIEVNARGRLSRSARMTSRDVMQRAERIEYRFDTPADRCRALVHGT